MKSRAIFLFFGALTILFAQHGFQLTCIDDTFQYLMPGGLAFYRFHLKNVGSGSDSFEIKISVIESVPGWGCQVCARGRCVPPGVPLVFSLSPGEVETTIVVDIFAGQTPGREKVQFFCRSLGDTTLRRTQNLYAQVGQAIEEAVKSVFPIPSPLLFENVFYSIDGRAHFSELRKSGIYFLPNRRKVLVIKN
jgi:hypothetical protein